MVVNKESLSWLKEQPDNTIDSIVTDPPYLIDFMGKKWDSPDSVAGKADFWKEALRVLKPGGHISVFSHSRTYHRVASAIEDAGFEIRDQIMWIYASGFPKSHSVNKAYGKKSYKNTEHRVRQVLQTYLQETEHITDEQREILLSQLQKQGLSLPGHSTSDVWSGQSCLEGWEDSETLCEIQECLCSLSRAFDGDGTKGWLHSGAPYGDGSLHWQTTDQEGGGASHRPQSTEQLYSQLDAIFNEWRAQEVGVEQSIQSTYDGIGTALKPSHEPICLARKPLSEKTVVDNVIKWGTGGINIDDCRVEGITDKEKNWTPQRQQSKPNIDFGAGGLQGKEVSMFNPEGRFPANTIHDGSDEVLDLFPKQAGGGTTNSRTNVDSYVASGPQRTIDLGTTRGFNDSGSAARFFYCAKVSKKERNVGLDKHNIITLIWKSTEGEDQKVTLQADTEVSHAKVTEGCSAESRRDLEWNIESFGNDITERYQKDFSSIISTKTNSTTISATFNWLTHLLTNDLMVDANFEKMAGINPALNVEKQSTLTITTNPKKDGSKESARVVLPNGQLEISINAKTSTHPTVKPVALMAYLIKLITPKGGTVLDLFNGSGSTGMAAKQEGFNYIGIEMDPEYCKISEARIDAWQNN